MNQHIESVRKTLRVMLSMNRIAQSTFNRAMENLEAAEKQVIPNKFTDQHIKALESYIIQRRKGSDLKGQIVE